MYQPSLSVMDLLVNIETAKYVLLVLTLPIIGYLVLSKIYPRTYKNIPPGPREWGTNWTLLKASWNGTIPLLATEWSKKYGDIIFVNNFGKPLVFLNTAEIARKLLASDKYKFLLADRPQIAGSKITKYDGKDLMFSKYDEIMRKKRRLFYKIIGLYGDGVAKFENVVWEEIERMFTEIDDFDGEDAEITNILARSLKIIFYILAVGERPGDPTIPDILEQFDLTMSQVASAEIDVILNYLPFLTRIPGRFKKMVDRLKHFQKLADEIMFHSQKRTYVPNHPRGVTDLLLDSRNKPGYEWMKNDEQHIVAFIGNLFLAAHLTSRASLFGIFLCLLNYPEVTRKIQGEVDRVIGNERPKMEHKTSMPYTEASIIESLRLISQVPLAAFRIISSDIEFEGMILPKNSLIFQNNFAILHDEKVWEEPWIFKPERFLDKEGQLLPTDHPIRKNMVAFGLGVRACPGEQFARSRVFLFVTSIIQRYDLSPPVNEKLIPADFQVRDENIRGIIRQPPGFKCRLIRRKRV